jgi:hypothetical protein
MNELFYWILIVLFGIMLGFAYKDIEIMQEKIVMLETRQEQFFMMAAETYPKHFIPGEPEKNPVLQ